jgi:hypothetical protein
MSTLSLLCRSSVLVLLAVSSASQAQDLHLKKNISAGDTWSRQPKRRSKRRGNEASLSRRTAAETMRLHYVLGGERNTQFPAVSVSS